MIRASAFRLEGRGPPLFPCPGALCTFIYRYVRESVDGSWGPCWGRRTDFLLLDKFPYGRVDMLQISVGLLAGYVGNYMRARSGLGRSCIAQLFGRQVSINAINI